MSYVYDIVLNFNNSFYEFYEWKKDDYCIVRRFTKNDINNNIVICSKVTKCIFTQEDNKIRVQLTINNKDQKDMEYIAENLQIGN